MLVNSPPRSNSLDLELVSWSYAGLAAFESESRERVFSHGQGLPGKAWELGHPVLMKSDDAFFLRSEAAKRAGVATGIALPVFAGDYLTGVAVFLCGDDQDSVGAIEIWHCDTSRSHDMMMKDGYFGSLEHFESLARYTSFRPGTGLPGEVWQSKMPVVMNDLGRSHRFMRFAGAQKAGITTGLGIPVFHDPTQAYVMTFLSAKGTPIARQIEVWAPDSDGGLRFLAGYSESGRDLDACYASTFIAPKQGTLGRVLLTGAPSIGDDLPRTSNGKRAVELTSMLAIPVLEHGRCKAIVALYR
jgi:hypothetical protein